MKPIEYIWDNKTKKMKAVFKRRPSESVVAAIAANVRYAKKMRLQEMNAKKKKKPIFKPTKLPEIEKVQPIEKAPINLFKKLEKPVSIGGLA